MTRVRRRPSALWLAAATAAATVGCGLSQEGVRPHQDTIAYPASAVMDSSGNWLIVANSNADLRYNDGTLIAINVGLAAEDRRNGGVGGAAATCPSVNYVNPRRGDDDSNKDFCCLDPLDPYVLLCDERRYVRPEASVRIGSFAAGMLRQQPKCSVTPNPCFAGCMANQVEPFPQRLLIAVRGDTSLTYVDVKPGTEDTPPVFDCGGASSEGPEHEEFAPCDDDHRIKETEAALAVVSGDEDPPMVRFPDEPYALAVDEDTGLLYVGHLAGATNRPGSGGVSLFDVAPVLSPFDGMPVMPPPRFIASFPGIFAPNANGLYGVTSVRWEPGRGVFATSRYVPMVTGLAATDPFGCDMRRKDGQPIRELAIFGSGGTYATTLAGTETRGIQFVNTPDVEHAFVLQRVPPALVGFSNGTPTEFIEVCQSPTFLHKHDAGAGDRLFINCFDTGEVYVIDPSIPRVERIFGVGRGPAGLVFPENDPTVAYVVGFSDNNITVVDIAPGSRSQYHVVQRIGFPNSVPR